MSSSIEKMEEVFQTSDVTPLAEPHILRLFRPYQRGLPCNTAIQSRIDPASQLMYTF
ncbi:hypothetical protein HLI01_27295 [Rhizobium laguerreae]|uniref:hypothetical protein n=1 Tax=Rhizobium laguerreae TaxID=1076926 RepID=UPI00147938B9|nr:hypothetical protein [Rhizobium laguerreae]NNH60435.1 hypothetical protein [Rhizobium laguerreae]